MPCNRILPLKHSPDSAVRRRSKFPLECQLKMLRLATAAAKRGTWVENPVHTFERHVLSWAHDDTGGENHHVAQFSIEHLAVAVEPGHTAKAGAVVLQSLRAIYLINLEFSHFCNAVCDHVLGITLNVDSR